MTGFLRAYLRRQDEFVIDKTSKIQNLLSVKTADRIWEFKKREVQESRFKYNYNKYVPIINFATLFAEFPLMLR